MIDVKELRIGNWIIDAGCGKTQIKGEMMDEYLWRGENAFPIPLTPEILEACGFETDKLSYWHEYTIDGAVFWITIGHFKDGFRMLPTGSLQIPGRKINGLHDLQNLVHSLTGKELTYSPNNTVK